MQAGAEAEHFRTDHLLQNIGHRAVSGGFVTVGAPAQVGTDKAASDNASAAALVCGLTICIFISLADLHTAYLIKRRTSAQRTQAFQGVDTRKSFSA